MKLLSVKHLLNRPRRGSESTFIQPPRWFWAYQSWKGTPATQFATWDASQFRPPSWRQNLSYLVTPAHVEVVHVYFMLNCSCLHFWNTGDCKTHVNKVFLGHHCAGIVNHTWTNKLRLDSNYLHDQHPWCLDAAAARRTLAHQRQLHPLLPCLQLNRAVSQTPSLLCLLLMEALAMLSWAPHLRRAPGQAREQDFFQPRQELRVFWPFLKIYVHELN